MVSELQPVASNVSRRGPAFAALWAIACIALYFLWRLFWFLTDDAFIAFRYISNARSGHGYVWNPPPFRPVEGYTSFLWVALLDFVWRATEIEPPEAANWIALGFAFGTLGLTVATMARLRLRPALARARIGLAALALVFVLSNRTFLAWTSSGLETAMFNFWLTGWLWSCLFVRRGSARWVFGVAAFAALAELTRPDGMLFLAASCALLAFAWIEQAARREFRWRALAAALPLAAVPAHILWRRRFYGEWLPNTYYAKVSGVWFESGWRYLGSFLLEYALWIWLIAAAAWLAAEAWRFAKKIDRPSLSGLLFAAIPIGAIAAHIGYYTIVVGGDHFEFRAFSQLIPWLFIAMVWMLNRLRLGSKTAAAILALWIGLAQPIPWIHWSASQAWRTRETTLQLVLPVAEWLPAPLRPLGRAFDSMQAWLISHSVCMRHQEHKVFYLDLVESIFPSREQGRGIAGDGYPVVVFPCVGVLGWVFPNINIIDEFGLNDYVIARQPPAAGLERALAHDRRPPPGYAEAFKPNVILYPYYKTASVQPRESELTAEEIRAAETKHWRDARQKTVREASGNSNSKGESP